MSDIQTASRSKILALEAAMKEQEQVEKEALGASIAPAPAPAPALAGYVAPSTCETLKIAVEIARGMDHLVKANFVHRDLAARNVLLDVRMNVKVADFGLSRSFGDGGSDYYRSAGGPIPLRWSVNYS